MNQLLTRIKTDATLALAHIYYDPAFNEGEAKTLFKSWAEPINRVILWAVPFIAVGALGYSWISWSAKDDNEREQNPFMKTAKKIIATAILVELTSAIFRIFGLNTD